MHRTLRGVAALAMIAGLGCAGGISTVAAQGSAGTGNISTGIGSPTGPAGPGRRGDFTQQPSIATNPRVTNPNLSPAQKNSIPPQNAPSNAVRVPR
jgi:hypothetical protein